MQQQISHQEAVRLAKERLGDVPATELATHIQGAFGLTIQPAIVSVLLCSFKEREALDRTGQAVREELDRWRAENPEEARKMAATLKRREAARRKAAATKENQRVVPPRADTAPIASIELNTAVGGQELFAPMDSIANGRANSGGVSASLPTL